jgi:hypothetical protein
MSCARIRNKPVRFLDPQQKLILDLKDEIRRLKHENRKLRSTLLTAPAGDGKMLEDDASYARAASAHSPHRHDGRMDMDEDSGTQHNRPTHRNNKLQQRQEQHARRTNHNKAMKRLMQETRSDIFANYPQLKQILQQAEPLHKSAPRLPLQKALQAAAVFDILLQSQAQEDADADERSLHSQQSQSTLISSPARKVVDDLVHIPGPMIFKDHNSSLQPVRETHDPYYPAQNYTKTMDAKRIRLLEERVRMMEQKQLKCASFHFKKFILNLTMLVWILVINSLKLWRMLGNLGVIWSNMNYLPILIIVRLQKLQLMENNFCIRKRRRNEPLNLSLVSLLA